MTDLELKIAIGGMLHDIGKVLFRAADGRNHSISGYDFLREEIGITDRQILDQVRYHHSALLKQAALDDDSPAYITYMADNIAAAADRRKKDDGTPGFDREMALESVFDILNGKRGAGYYRPATLEPTGNINMPQSTITAYDEAFYRQIRDNLYDILKHLKEGDTIENNYIDSLLEVLEANLTYIPSSTSASERSDVSLYDHVKLTAALGNCIYAYLEDRNEHRYKEVLYLHGSNFYGEKAFLLCGMDMSGIQDFIYHQYGTENVLKNLRARSFYLEIMMENLIDELLLRVSLSRANLIYCGGGHAYLLLPNVEAVIDTVKEFIKDTNAWLLAEYETGLFVACGYVPCSADDLKNEPQGSYAALFKTVSDMISDHKMKRYDAGSLRILNRADKEPGERECRICHRQDRLDEEGYCDHCRAFMKLSGDVLNKDKIFFSISSEGEGEALALYKGRYLKADTFETLKKKIKSDPYYVRAYGKNVQYTGDSVATKIWTGDYADADTLGELVGRGRGIRRLGVLRADVDNLGQAFTTGFPEEYQTLSRAATFSRMLALFFKLHINDILKRPEYSMDGAIKERHAAVIYAGGDDVFVVGAWKDVLEFSVDLYERLKEFSQGALTISAGFGVFHPAYPISYIAEQTGALESASKGLSGKSALTLFSDEHSFRWEELKTHVLEEKFRTIHRFFSSSEDRGKSYLYHLLELFRAGEEKINLARLAYLLARLAPDKDAAEDQKEQYATFSKQLYQWCKTKEDRRQTITAIYLYAYLVREDGEE